MLDQVPLRVTVGTFISFNLLAIALRLIVFSGSILRNKGFAFEVRLLNNEVRASDALLASSAVPLRPTNTPSRYAPSCWPLAYLRQ